MSSTEKDDDLAALDALERVDPGEPTTNATSLIDLSALDEELSGHDDTQLAEDQRRAKELGVSMASVQIAPLPESPRAMLHFNDQRAPQPVTKSVFVIGRAQEFADVVIASEAVSRHHAALIFAGGEFFIEDLNSTNGTSLSGKRIKRARLEPEVPVSIGATTFRLRWEY